MGKVSNSLWHNLYAIEQIFFAENGQILKTQFGHLVTLVANFSLALNDTFFRLVQDGSKAFTLCYDLIQSVAFL